MENIGRHAKGYIVTSISVILMSQSVIVSKIAFSTISPFTFIWMSIGVGIISMMLYTFIFKKESVKKKPISKQMWFFIFAIGLLNFIFGQFTTFSLFYLSANTNTFLSKFAGFLTMFFSIIILKESPKFTQIIGALIGLVGLITFFPNALKQTHIVGTLLVFIGITCLAITNNLSRKFQKKFHNPISNNLFSTLVMLTGGIPMIIICIIIDGFPPKLKDASDLIMILNNGILVKAIALTLWNKSLNLMRSYEVSLLGASMIIWTAFFAWLFLGETLLWNQVVGIGLLFIGLSLIQVPNLNNYKNIKI